MSFPRPSRKSALAAREAITSTAANDQGVTVAELKQAVTTQQQIYTSYLESTAAKRIKLAHAVIQPGLPAHSTDPFRFLPLEILTEIIAQLELEDYEILQLMRTSKTWYVTLTARREAEWEKKCKQFGAKAKCRGCNSWYLSWMKLMRLRCISCKEKARPIPSRRFGAIWDEGPAWAILCHRCPSRYRYFEIRDLMCPDRRDEVAGLNQAELQALPSLQVAPEYPWRTYWRRSIDKRITQIQAEAKRKLELLVTSFQGNREQLRAAIVTSREKDFLRWSRNLERLFNESVDDKESITTTVGEEIIALYGSILVVLVSLPILYSKNRQRWSGEYSDVNLGELPSRPIRWDSFRALQGRSWLDSLCLKETEAEDYLDKFCVLRPVIRKCANGSCTKLPAYACWQDQCGDCCTGPCERHGHGVDSDDYYFM